jgi:hypothetical protein
VTPLVVILRLLPVGMALVIYGTLARNRRGISETVAAFLSYIR